MPKIKINIKPISLNTAYPTGSSGRRFLSAIGKAYKLEIAWAVRQEFLTPLVGDLRAEYVFGFSDKRKRDLDNYIKLCQDAVVMGQGMEDDSQITELTAKKVSSLVDFVEITITEKKENT